MSSTIVMSGRMILSKEKPLALRAVSSLCSAKLPKVMSEESNMAKGSAIGIIPAETYTSSSRITQTLSPFPIKSSMYTQKNCKISMNIEIRSVTINGPVKDFRLNRTRRFKRVV